MYGASLGWNALVAFERNSVSYASTNSGLPASLPCTCSVNAQMNLLVLEFMITDGEGEGESKGDLFEGGPLT